MENEQLKQTKFDSMVTNRQMQLAKAVIPYIDNRIGIFIGMYIKLQELQNAANINTSVAVAAMNTDKHGGHNGIEGLFDDLKDFMGDEEKETIDTILSMMEMMNMEDEAKQNFMGSYMDMFGM